MSAYFPFVLFSCSSFVFLWLGIHRISLTDNPARKFKALIKLYCPHHHHRHTPFPVLSGKEERYLPVTTLARKPAYETLLSLGRQCGGQMATLWYRPTLVNPGIIILSLKQHIYLYEDIKSRQMPGVWFLQGLL